jgi:hypothetical protein
MLPTQEMNEAVRAVVLEALSRDQVLRDRVSQMQWLATGFVLTGDPSKTPSGSWQVPFAAYAVERK